MVGIAVGGAAALVVILYLFMACRNNGDDYKYQASTVIVLHFSVATVACDYSKAYGGGGNTLCLRLVGRSDPMCKAFGVGPCKGGCDWSDPWGCW